MTPKVFVVYASEDKSRFAFWFAERLRQHGMHVLLDRWEIHPGDSLVDKIFEDGIKEAQAIIVILSKCSSGKPWVEELDDACVARIKRLSRLITVAIDGCKTPASLNSADLERFVDGSAYETSLARIVASICGPVGVPDTVSALASSFSGKIGALNEIDSMVLRRSCEAALGSGNRFIKPGNIFPKDGEALLPAPDLDDSLEMLDKDGYIKMLRTIGDGSCHYHITTHGFEVYANACIPGYPDKVAAMISAIARKKIKNNIALQQELNEPQMLIDHMLDRLEISGHLTDINVVDGTCRIYDVTPAMKRSRG